MPYQPPSVNPGYILGQLEKALAALLGSPDEAGRARAVERVARWQSVLSGMESGALTIGSRVPVADTPVWATLEVIHGGFATGALLVEGPLLPHEEALLARLPAAVGTERGRLNRWFLSPDGRRELLADLDAGRIRIDAPEEAALPVVAWLLARGDTAEALDLLEVLGAYLDRLRFYPAPADTARSIDSVVRRQPASTVAHVLRQRKPPAEIARMRETLLIWNPLCDRLVSLFLETVEGETPRFEVDAEGKPIRGPNGGEVIVGGWPCRVWPPGWFERAEALAQEYRALRREHTLGRRPDDPKSNLGRLLALAGRAIAGRGALDARDAGWIRRVLAAFVSRHGRPDSEDHRRVRGDQERAAAQPLHATLARLVAARLEHVSPDAGIPDLRAFAGPVGEQESGSAPPGATIPPSIEAKLLRCLEAPVEELVRLGAIPSAEVLAEVLPQVTGAVVSAGIADPTLMRLYSATYAAFRRRRSLLLLNYERQVQFEELPWVAAMQRFRTNDAESRTQAGRSLQHAAALSLTVFPHTLVPNPLITEFQALAKAAGLEIPWVEELAADIFMGSFTPKFARAAEAAERLLRGSVYARYYDLPEWPDAPPLTEPTLRSRIFGAAMPKSGASPVLAERFAEVCRTRAREAGGGQGTNVADIGTVIEQSQILTTHNLAALFLAVDLREACRPVLPAMAERCIREVVVSLSRLDERSPNRLSEIKNAAYAWRQMMFYLSFLDSEGLLRSVAWATALHAKEGKGICLRLGPALDGLAHIVDGGRFDEAGRSPGGGRRFLGWTVGSHWLLGANRSPDRGHLTC